eukprot:433109-Prorocentrum_minimum.AAC.1
MPNAKPLEEDVLLGAMAASLGLSDANRTDFAGPVTVAADSSSSANRGQSQLQCSCPARAVLAVTGRRSIK